VDGWPGFGAAAAAAAAVLLALIVATGRADAITKVRATGSGPATRISPIALTFFADAPCELLSFTDWQAATGEKPDRDTTDHFANGGLCQWDLHQPINQDYLLGQAAVQKTPWSKLLHAGATVHMQGLSGFCATTPNAPLNSRAYLYLELTPAWYLGVSTGSCAAAKYLATGALNSLKTLKPAH
jgi:hypothetical protein